MDWVARLPSRDARSPDRNNDILEAGDSRIEGGECIQPYRYYAMTVMVTDGSALRYVAAADRESTKDDMGIR